mgnify:CR=1 FL=1
MHIATPLLAAALLASATVFAALLRHREHFASKRVGVVLTAASPMFGIYPILAQKHGHDGPAAAAQMGTTVVSFFTLTLLLWALRQQGIVAG